MKDKIILVYYIDIRDIAREGVPEFLSEFASDFKLECDDTFQYFVPIHGDNRVECINPKVVSEEEYRHVLAKLEECRARIEEWGRPAEKEGHDA